MRYSTDDMTEIMGIGNYVGEVRRGPDGQLYQWVEGVDGLGNPIGFWRTLKKFGKKIVGKVTSAIPGARNVKRMVKGFCRALPQIQPIVSLHPAVGPFARIGTRVCKTLRKVGLAGVEGEIMQASDGQHYEVVEGIGEFGDRRMMLRPVRLIIPAHIKAGGRMPSTATPMVPGTKAVRTPPRVSTARRSQRFRRFR